MRAYSTSTCSAAVKAPPTVPASTKTRSSTRRAEGRCPGPSLPYEPRTLIFIRPSSSNRLHLTPWRASTWVEFKLRDSSLPAKWRSRLVTLAGLEPLSWATLRTAEPVWEDAADDLSADCQRGCRLYCLPDRMRPGRGSPRCRPLPRPGRRLPGLRPPELTRPHSHPRHPPPYRPSLA